MAKNLLKIESRAPTRMDLAGGTVDIWPIYLFLPQAVTINQGISLFAEAHLEEHSGSREILLRSDDQNHELKLGWDQLETASAPPQLELHLKFLRYFAREKAKAQGGLAAISQNGLSLRTLARSPAGAGLGGSSTLSIAMIGALATWSRGQVDVLKDGERLIEIARDTETTVINVPAGLQDYYGAMFGGLQSLRWGVGAHSRDWLSSEISAELEKRIVLFYSGQSRNSGINNWALFKSFIDRQGQVRDQFQAIVKATHELETALNEKDWKAAGQAIAREWEVRRTLAPGISTPEMDKAFAIANQEGATAGKVCGAGGGGCFFVYVPSGDAKAKDRIREKIEALGVRHLPFQAVPRGLEIKVSRG